MLKHHVLTCVYTVKCLTARNVGYGAISSYFYNYIISIALFLCHFMLWLTFNTVSTKCKHDCYMLMYVWLCCRCCAHISELEHTYFRLGQNQAALPKIQQDQRHIDVMPSDDLNFELVFCHDFGFVLFIGLCVCVCVCVHVCVFVHAWMYACVHAYVSEWN